MNRSILGAALFAGSLLLALPSPADARCSGSGPTFRCDPIMSESLKRKSLGLPPRYTPRSSTRYSYEGNTFTVPSTGATFHRYRYKSPSGRTYRGKTTVLPGGSYQHRGSWR